MKIICTKSEKEKLLKVIYKSASCPFEDIRCVDDPCLVCIERHIDWEVKDESINQ